VKPTVGFTSGSRYSLPERDAQFLTTTILWIHAAAGALWIGACACFVIAGLALAPGTDEQKNFAINAAPKIDRLAMLSAGLLFLTGLLNLSIAGAFHGFAFSTAFVIVLAIKVALFIAMVSVMHWSMRIAAVIMSVVARGRTDAVPTAITRMTKAHAAVVAMGAIALILGLWLIGT
jgi:hypothetical protein